MCCWRRRMSGRPRAGGGPQPPANGEGEDAVDGRSEEGRPTALALHLALQHAAHRARGAHSRGNSPLEALHRLSPHRQNREVFAHSCSHSQPSRALAARAPHLQRLHPPRGPPVRGGQDGAGGARVPAQRRQLQLHAGPAGGLPVAEGVRAQCRLARAMTRSGGQDHTGADVLHLPEPAQRGGAQGFRRAAQAALRRLQPHVSDGNRADF